MFDNLINQNAAFFKSCTRFLGGIQARGGSVDDMCSFCHICALIPVA